MHPSPAMSSASLCLKTGSSISPLPHTTPQHKWISGEGSADIQAGCQAHPKWKHSGEVVEVLVPISDHTTTGVTPSELHMGRRPRSRWDLLYPDLSTKVRDKQVQQKGSHDNQKHPRSFSVGDLVFSEDFTKSSVAWVPGKVIQVTGPLSYVIELTSGTTVRRHIDSVRRREVAPVQDRGVEPENELVPDSPLMLGQSDDSVEQTILLRRVPRETVPHQLHQQ